MFFWIYVSIGFLIGCICLDKLDKWIKMNCSNSTVNWQSMLHAHREKWCLKGLFFICSIIIWLPLVTYGVVKVIYSIITLPDDEDEFYDN